MIRYHGRSSTINVVPLDSVPIEAVDVDALAERVGAVLVALDVNQPAPIYGEYSYLAEPDEAVVRILIEQMVSVQTIPTARCCSKGGSISSARSLR